MENLLYLEYMLYFSYALTFFSFYFIIGIIFYINRSSQIKVLNFTLDPKKVARNRKIINASLEKVTREKQLALLWPLFLLEGISNYVKKKFEKKE